MRVAACQTGTGANFRATRDAGQIDRLENNRPPRVSELGEGRGDGDCLLCDNEGCADGCGLLHVTAIRSLSSRACVWLDVESVCGDWW